MVTAEIIIVIFLFGGLISITAISIWSSISENKNIENYLKKTGLNEHCRLKSSNMKVVFDITNKLIMLFSLGRPSEPLVYNFTDILELRWYHHQVHIVPKDPKEPLIKIKFFRDKHCDLAYTKLQSILFLQEQHNISQAILADYK